MDLQNGPQQQPAASPEGRRREPVAVVRPLEVAAAYSWRILIVLAVTVLTVIALAQLLVIVMPVFVALLGASILRPPARWLQERGLRPALAALTVVGGGVLLFAGILALILPPIISQTQEIADNVRSGVEEVGDWLLTGPLDLSQDELQGYIDDAEQSLSDNSSAIAGGVIGGARALVEIVTGLLLAAVITFFFVKDGSGIRYWFVNLFPPSRRDDVAEMSLRAWETLSAYLRGVTFVAFVDAFFIGLGLAIVGVPAVLPLAVLTFIGAYIPFVGAFLAGTVATLFALVSNGPLEAAIVLAIVIGVQQLEGNVLQPVVVGRTISLHPLAVLLGVTAGVVIGGIPGAILAVPTIAVIARIAPYLRRRNREEQVMGAGALDRGAPSAAGSGTPSSGP